MKQSQNITVPRGTNIGQAIKEHLISCRLYKRVQIINIESKRNVKDRTITASITYKLN